MSRALTRLGLNREQYSRDVEPAPSRFTDTDAYARWCSRADDTLDLDTLAELAFGPIPASIRIRQGDSDE